MSMGKSSERATRQRLPALDNGPVGGPSGPATYSLSA